MLDWTRYEATADAFALLGFNVIPLPPGAKGCAGSGVTFKHLNKPNSRRITDEDRRQWKRTFKRKAFAGIVGAYLLPNSGERWHIAVVDIDDPAYADRVARDFPNSQACVERSGRLRHIYYRTSEPRRAHFIGIYGKGTVDVISTTGVVLPGSVHADGGTYTLVGEFRDLPELPLDMIDELRGARRGALKQDLDRADLPISDSEGFLHTAHPREFGDSVWCGSILPGTMIDTVDGPKPIRDIEPGLRCFATYREDNSPSAHTSDHNGRRHFWDMSASPHRYWTMVDEESDDPELEIRDDQDYTAQLEQALITRLGVDVVVLPDVGYISEQIPEIPDNTTAFVVASHGTGKTWHSKREHDRAATSISVCNTQALTVANAAVLGLTAVYEEIADKASVCVPSLPRYEHPPEFFHVDEADAVAGFLHSGKVRQPLEVWRTLMHFAARSTRSLFASADLAFEDIALFVKAIRARNATRRFVVYIRVPSRRLKIRLCSIGRVKGAIHNAIKSAAPLRTPRFVMDRKGVDSGTAAAPMEEGEPRGPGPEVVYPVVVGITTRKLAFEISQGYRSGGDVRAVDVAEVADVIDSPTPENISIHDEGTGVDSAFWLSGQNSRFDQAVDWLSDTARLVRSHRLIVTSPAVQSGVSLDPPVACVCILHGNREVPASAVLQIIRRARNPVDPVVLLGMPAWEPQTHRTDRAYLDDLIDRKARTTIAAIAAHFPKLTDEHSPEPDAEFAHSWRISTRRMIRSYADPVGELRRAALRHGIEWLEDEEPVDVSARKSFSRITSAAAVFRETTNAKQTASAPVIDSHERERLSKAPRLASGERMKLDRAEIERFYDRPVTPALVTLDNGGKYRRVVCDYVHVQLLDGFEEVVAYLDHEKGAGTQPSERPHYLARAFILRSLFDYVFGEWGSTFEFKVHEARPRIIAWWQMHHRRARSFYKRMRGPADEYETRWICDRLRSIGAVSRTVGENSNRRKIVSFELVEEHSAGYAARLFAAYERREGEEWIKEWQKKN